MLPYPDLKHYPVSKYKSQQSEAAANYWEELFKCRIKSEKKDFREFNSDRFENNFDIDHCKEKAEEKFASKWNKTVNKTAAKVDENAFKADNYLLFDEVVDLIYDGVDSLYFSEIWDEKQSESSLSILLYKACLKNGKKQLLASAKNIRKENAQAFEAELNKIFEKFEKKWLKAQKKASKKNIEFIYEEDKSYIINTINTMVTQVNSLISTGEIAEIYMINPDVTSSGNEVTIEGISLGNSVDGIYLEHLDGNLFNCIVNEWVTDENGESIIRFVVPDVPEEVYNIIIDTEYGRLYEEDAFFVEPPIMPAIDMIYPDYGVPFDEIMIDGTKLGAAPGKIFIENDGGNRFECTIAEWEMYEADFTFIEFLVPEVEEGLYNVVVEGEYGTVISENAFTVEPSL